MISQLTSRQQDSEIDDSPSSLVDPDYLQHLKLQCTIRYNALKTAEALIAAYQKENEALKAENSSLWQLVRKHDNTLSGQNGKLITPNKSFCKCGVQMDELLQLSEEKDRRILNLEKKLAHFEERQLRLRQFQREQEHQQRNRTKVQKTFNDFLKLPLKPTPNKPSPNRSEKSSLRVLQAQLEQKEAEVMMLLRRLRDVEQEIGRKKRVKTSDTVENSSYHKKAYSCIEE